MIAVAYLLRTQWLTQLPLQLIVVVLLGFIGGYTLYDMLDPHDLDRYLAVLVPILYLLTSMALERGHKNWPARVQVATLGLLFLWALYPITRTVHNVILWHNMSCSP